MDNERISEGEWKVMNVVWDREPVFAKVVTDEIEALYGWKANTTYTVLTRLIEKGIIDRKYPRYTISSLVSREEMRNREIEYMLTRMFDGSRTAMFSAFLGAEELSDEEIKEIKALLKKSEK